MRYENNKVNCFKLFLHIRRFCTVFALELSFRYCCRRDLGTSCLWNEITGTGMKKMIRVVGNLLEQHFDKAEGKWHIWE